MKPILFNTEMVKAILNGRKTQTRRVIPLKNNDLMFTGFVVSSTAKNREGYCAFGKNKEQDLEFIKPKYKVGDILYVKETWTLGKKFTIKPENVWYIRNDLGNEVYYKADLNDNFYDPDNICKWKPSIHMPKNYARIFLKVTNARVERLQDITFDDIEKYGIKFNLKINGKNKFKILWNSTAKDGYKYLDNPYVFVYEFEMIHDV